MAFIVAEEGHTWKIKQIKKFVYTPFETFVLKSNDVAYNQQ